MELEAIEKNALYVLKGDDIDRHVESSGHPTRSAPHPYQRNTYPASASPQGLEHHPPAPGPPEAPGLN